MPYADDGRIFGDEFLEKAKVDRIIFRAEGWAFGLKFLDDALNEIASMVFSCDDDRLMSMLAGQSIRVGSKKEKF
jgi:hypothetical protein